MEKENYITKILILCLVFIPSLTLFWDIITVIFGYEKFYSVFQFAFAAYFTIFSIFLTKDMEYFKQLWENNSIICKWVDKILHISGVFIAWFPRIILLIAGAISDADAEIEVELNRIEARKQVTQYDNMPVAARTILPVGAVSLVMLMLVGFNVLSEHVLSWIQEVLNTFVSLVGLYFVVMNVKENEMTNQDDK